MAERKALPAAKKAAASTTAGKVAVKPNTIKAVAAAKPKRTNSPAVKKAAVPAVARKGTAQKTAAAKARPAARKAVAQPSPEERYRMVQTAAYFIAERNGFGGCPSEYWAAAELEIANRLGV